MFTVEMLTTLDVPAVIDPKAIYVLVKNRNFCLPLWGLCRNIAITFGTEKLECKIFEDILIRFDRIHRHPDGRTDGQTCTA